MNYNPNLLFSLLRLLQKRILRLFEMKTSIKIKNQTIDFYRNWFTGSFTYSINGETKKLASALNPFEHFSVKLSKSYIVNVDDASILILKTRPLLLAGIRKQNYKFFVDKTLVKEIDSL